MWAYYGSEYRSDVTASSIGTTTSQWTPAEASMPVAPVKRPPEHAPAPLVEDNVHSTYASQFDDPLTLELLNSTTTTGGREGGGGTWHRWPPDGPRQFYNSTSNVYVHDTLTHHKSPHVILGIATLLHSFMRRSAAQLSADALNYFYEFNVLPALPHEDQEEEEDEEDDEEVEEILDETPHQRIAGYVRWVPTVGAIVDFLTRLKATTGHPDEVDLVAFVYAHRILRWRPDFHTFHLTRRNWRITWTCLASLAAKVVDDFPFKVTLALDWRLVNDVDIGLFRRLQTRAMELLDFSLVVRPSVQLRYFLALLAAARHAPRPPAPPAPPARHAATAAAATEPGRPATIAEFRRLQQQQGQHKPKKRHDADAASEAASAAAPVRRAAHLSVLDTLASARRHSHRIAAAQASARRQRHRQRAAAAEHTVEEDTAAPPPQPATAPAAVDTPQAASGADMDTAYYQLKRARRVRAAATLEDVTLTNGSRHVLC